MLRQNVTMDRTPVSLTNAMGSSYMALKQFVGEMYDGEATSERIAECSEHAIQEIEALVQHLEQLKFLIAADAHTL